MNCTLSAVIKSRKKYEEEVKNGKDEFQEALKKRQLTQLLKLLFSVFDAVTNIFSSVYNAAHIISYIHKKFQGIQNTLKSINSIIEKLKEIDKRVIKKMENKYPQIQKDCIRCYKNSSSRTPGKYSSRGI